MSALDGQVLLDALNFVFASNAIKALFVVGVAVLFFCIFMFGSVALVYLLAFSWAGFEEDFDDGDDEEFAFDEFDVVDSVSDELTVIFATLAALGSMLAGIVASVANNVAQNFLTYLVFLLAFSVIVVWDAWHNLALQAVSETLSCFVYPVVRTLVLPVANIAALVSGAVLPVVNIARQLIVSVTSETLFDSLTCAGEAALEVLRLLSAALVLLGQALVAWLQTDAGGGSPLDVGPDFGPTGLALGQAVASLQVFVDCACMPLSDIFFTPLFGPARSLEFAAAVNGTLAVLPVFVFQGIAAPLVRTIVNAAEMPSASITDIIVRPSYNRSFDTLSAAMLNATSVVDLYVQAGFNATLNIAGTIQQGCPDRIGWNNTRFCSEQIRTNGTCNSGMCETPFVNSQAGCCFTSGSISDCAVLSEDDCPLDTFVGQTQCTDPAILATGSCLGIGCCTGLTDPDGEPFCADHVGFDDCEEEGGVLLNLFQCAAVDDARLANCSKIIGRGLPQTRVDQCGSCDGPDGAPCQCSRCACEYQVEDSRFVALDDFPLESLTALDECEEPPTADDVCFSMVLDLELPTGNGLDALPPAQGLFTGIVDLSYHLVLVSVPRYLFNILFNVDRVLTSFDGFEVLRFNDTIGENIRRGTRELVADVRWLGNFSRTVGANLNDADALSQPPSASDAIRTFDRFTVAQREQLNELFSREGQLADIALNIVAGGLDIVADVVEAYVNLVVRFYEELFDLLFGSLYGTIQTGVENGVPDPFAFARFKFGDEITPGITYDCNLPTSDGSAVTLFVQTVDNATATPCSERAELLEFCRFVYRRAIGGADDPLDSTPDLITVETLNVDIPLQANRCLESVTNCEPFIVKAFDEQEVEGGVNAFEDVLQKAVDVGGAISPFFASLLQPFVAPVLMIIDAFVHIPEIFSSGYLACLDFEGALNSVLDLVQVITDLLRALNQEATDRPCETGFSARDARILCALAQALDAVAQTVVEIVRFFWIILAGLIRVIDGTRELSAITDLLNINALVAPIEALTFGIVAAFMQVLPRTVGCAGLLSGSGVGCCTVVAEESLILPDRPICVARKTEEQCAEFMRNEEAFAFLVNPTVVTVFEGQTCAQAGVTCATVADPSPDDDDNVLFTFSNGCCQNVRRNDPNEVESCANEQFDFRCDNADRQNFLAGQQCDDVSFPECPEVGGVAQDIVTASLARIISDTLLLVPRIVIEAILAFLRVLTDFGQDDADGFIQVIEAIFVPIFEFVSDTLVQLGRIFGCAGAAAVKDLFDLVASVIDEILDIGLEIIAILLQLVGLVVFGIIEVVVLFTFTLIGESLSLLLEVIVFFLFGIFGTGFVCGLQKVACDVASALTFFTLDIPDESIDFAVTQCRKVDCCFAENAPIEPEDGSVSSCQPNDIQGMCSDSELRCPGDNSRKRTLLRGAELPFDIFALDAKSARKRAEPEREYPSEAFCGGYLAQTGGVAHIRAVNLDDETARLCLEVLNATASRGVSLHDARTAELRGLLAEQLEPLGRAVGLLRESGRAHWIMQHDRAVQQRERTIEELVVAPPGNRLHALMEEHHGVRYKRWRDRSHAERRQHRLARRSVWSSHRHHVGQQIGVDVLHIAMQAHDAFIVHREHETLAAWIRAHFVEPESGSDMARRSRKRSVAPTPETSLSVAEQRAAGFRVLSVHARRLFASWSLAAGRRLSAFVARFGGEPSAETRARDVRRQARKNAQLRGLAPLYEERFASAGGQSMMLARGVAPAENARRVRLLVADNPALDGIGLSACNESAQFTPCTDCQLVDNLVFAAEDAFNATVEFYPNGEFGFVSYVARFEEGIGNTLIDPIGEDTYTTCPKTVPFVLERLFSVRWFWDWDYSPLTDLLDQDNGGEAGNAVLVDQTAGQQQRLAARAGREDFDNSVFVLFDSIIRPVVNFVEIGVGSLFGATETQTLVRIFERFVQCDYSGALQCRSELLGIGLFDAVANTVLIGIGIAVVLITTLPAVPAALAFLPLVPSFYYLVMWIAYGASPLCTLPTLVGGIPGVPTCLPADVYDLLSETFPQCPPTIPASLIVEAAREEASQTLCATCGTAPPLQHCADAAGFLNGFDNIFYTLTYVFGDRLTLIVAQVFQIVAPAIGDTAALYTDAFVAELGDAGLRCNLITLPNIATAIALLALFVSIIVTSLSFLIGFSFLVFYLYYLTAYVINLLIMQIDQGFVQGTRVRKLKQD